MLLSMLCSLEEKESEISALRLMQSPMTKNCINEEVCEVTYILLLYRYELLNCNMYKWKRQRQTPVRTSKQVRTALEWWEAGPMVTRLVPKYDDDREGSVNKLFLRTYLKIPI